MTAPNGTLRAVRMSLRMSQDEFARALRDAGAPDASKRQVQRWESGTTTFPRTNYVRALEQVTGLPIASLGFSVPVPHARISEDGQGGHDVEAETPGWHATAAAPVARPAGNRSGVWLSRYQYFSSGRQAAFTGLHYVVILQHGDRLTVRSLPGSSATNSQLTMDLTVDGNVVTGTWVEQTSPDGYYRGARYHGAIQMLVEPTGHHMSGKWVGFGKEMDVNTGPWELVLQDASTQKVTLDRFNHPPEV
jgi:transcriptional regulator with XRE-family HTH domain